MSSTPSPAGLLDRAALAVGPGTAPAVAEELAALTGRPVLGYDAEGRITGAEGGAPDAPLVLVGATLPPALRGDPRVRWFHSVNAGVDALLDGGWPAGVLLTRTVGRMGERIGQYALAWVLADCQGVPGHLARTAARAWRREPSNWPRDRPRWSTAPGTSAPPWRARWAPPGSTPSAWAAPSTRRAAPSTSGSPLGRTGRGWAAPGSWWTRCR